MQHPSTLTVRYWKELHSSELIAQTIVAELVNKGGASSGQSLPRYVFYGAFTAETKHIDHWSEAQFRNNKKVENRREERWWQHLRKRNWSQPVGEKHIPNVWTKLWMPSLNTTYTQHTPQSLAPEHKSRLVSKFSETQTTKTSKRQW